MREIKFRAWCENRMFYGRSVNFRDQNWSLSEIEDSEIEYEPGGYATQDDGVLMQYTGIKDKNGKKIYEGDIVKRGNFIGIVNFCDHCAQFEIQRPVSGDPINGPYTSVDIKLVDLESDEDNEIIGNIYEHPDLLK